MKSIDDQEIRLNCVQEALRNRKPHESFKDAMKNAQKIYKFVSGSDEQMSLKKFTEYLNRVSDEIRKNRNQFR